MSKLQGGTGSGRRLLDTVPDAVKSESGLRLPSEMAQLET